MQSPWFGTHPTGSSVPTERASPRSRPDAGGEACPGIPGFAGAGGTPDPSWEWRGSQPASSPSASAPFCVSVKPLEAALPGTEAAGHRWLFKCQLLKIIQILKKSAPQLAPFQVLSDHMAKKWRARSQLAPASPLHPALTFMVTQAWCWPLETQSDSAPSQ